MDKTNDAIAEALERLAHLLEERGENPHRVKAYLSAAESVRHAERPLAELLQDGGLKALKVALPLSIVGGPPKKTDALSCVRLSRK